jgi:hypothetical protein
VAWLLFPDWHLCEIAVQMELLPTSIAERKYFHSVKPRELVGLGTLRALMPGWMDRWIGGSQESLEIESCDVFLPLSILAEAILKQFSAPNTILKWVAERLGAQKLP